MSRGIIGIFKYEEKGKKWCSVSVRSSETSEKLRIALQSEHPELKIELAKAFSFECNGKIADVEKKLRKLLVLAFGDYVPPYNEWECYKIDIDEIDSFISDVLSLCETVTDFHELSV